MIGVGELRKGVVIELDGTLYSVVEYQHIKVGRGSAQIRLKLKNVKAGHQMERTFQAGEKFNRVRLERRPVQYLYREGDVLYVMDTESYEQFTVSAETLGDSAQFLKENMVMDVFLHDEQPIMAELPFTVDLEVVETPPGFRGDTASGSTKPATLETGVVVNVPFFINVGDVLRVDTRDGSYIERVTS
jgi:elongation factor P